MPVNFRIPCPQCGKTILKKREGRCTHCGAPVTDHLDRAKDREERIERLVAVVGTGLVLLVLLVTGGLGLLEGVVMYGATGAAMFYLAKKTFTANRARNGKQ